MLMIISIVIGIILMVLGSYAVNHLVNLYIKHQVEKHMIDWVTSLLISKTKDQQPLPKVDDTEYFKTAFMRK